LLFARSNQILRVYTLAVKAVLLALFDIIGVSAVKLTFEVNPRVPMCQIDGMRFNPKLHSVPVPSIGYVLAKPVLVNHFARFPITL